MKIIKKLTDEEVKEILPKGLQDTFSANPEDLEYCMKCDGLRIKGHKCIDILE
jgi:hypothetical protein